jgi:hypothetical protein
LGHPDNGAKISSFGESHVSQGGTRYRPFRIPRVGCSLKKCPKELLGDSVTIFLSDIGQHAQVLQRGVKCWFKGTSKEKALNITILTGVNKVIVSISVHPGNPLDHMSFREMVEKAPSFTSQEVLAERALIGEEGQDGGLRARLRYK